MAMWFSWYCPSTMAGLTTQNWDCLAKHRKRARDTVLEPSEVFTCKHCHSHRYVSTVFKAHYVTLPRYKNILVHPLHNQRLPV